MMKSFEEVLKDNHVSRSIFNCRKWNEVKEAYTELYTAVEERNTYWEEKRQKLHDEWGKEFPTLEELEPINLSFTNWKEAAEQIKKEREALEKKVSIFQLRVEFEKKVRKEWVAELVRKAGDDCKLIVIKGGYKPYKENEERFNESVKKRKAASINYMSFCPIWIAFDPKKEYDTQDWTMYKADSSVEYIK